jgi:hypothetical protein
MVIPNLLVIGAMKSGTTSLHDYLDMHPEIQMSTPKELNFFNNEENYKKGSSWYSSFFKEGYRYNGESSVNYTKRQIFPFVPSRVMKHLGSDIKLIYVVRDPIDRFQSNFTDSKTYGDIPSSYSINEFIQGKLADIPLLKTSLYYYQIENYLSYFDLKNMYFIKAEDLKENPQSAMNKLFEFLGLKNITIEKTMLNQSASKTYYSTRFLELTQSTLLQGLKKIIPNKIITAIKDSRVMEYVSKKKIDVDIDVITAENRLLLKFFLSDDLKKFENLTKIKFVE